MDKLLDIHEVGELLGISVNTIYKYTHERRGVGAFAIKIGRHLRWRPEDIERWLEAEAKLINPETSRKIAIDEQLRTRRGR